METRADLLALTSRSRHVILMLVTLSPYIQTALSHARYKILDDKTYFGEIPGFPGVWADAKTLEKCRRTLQEVLEEWIVLKIRDRERLPPVAGKTLDLPEPALQEALAKIRRGEEEYRAGRTRPISSLSELRR